MDKLEEICKCGHPKEDHEFLEGVDAQHHCNVSGCLCADYEEGTIFDEIIGHVNRAKELMENIDNANPQETQIMSLKAQVRELILALGKLTKEMVEATA